MNLTCMIGLHDWDKWKTIEQYDLVQRQNGEKHYIGKGILQEKTCKLCEKKKLKKEEVR